MAAQLTRRVLASPLWASHALRPLSVGAALGAKTQAKASSSLDPVQQLFLDKLKEYKTKSTGLLSFSLSLSVYMYVYVCLCCVSACVRVCVCARTFTCACVHVCVAVKCLRV